jgi:deoxyribodipyrimidine photolyase
MRGCAGLLGPGQDTLVLAQEEVTSEELDVDAAVRAALAGHGRLQLLWGNTLFHRDDLPFARDMADLPDVFTPFRNKASPVVRTCAPRVAGCEGLREGHSGRIPRQQRGTGVQPQDCSCMCLSGRQQWRTFYFILLHFHR